jgi:F-box interacting protein
MVSAGLRPNFECTYRFNFAFGYDPIDPVNDDYKVLRIMECFESRNEQLAWAFEVKVYSLKAHCWTSVQAKWPYEGSRICSGPVSVNGASYWVVETVYRRGMLLAFHLATEKFRDHNLPVAPHKVKTLEVLGGSLDLCFRIWT